MAKGHEFTLEQKHEIIQYCEIVLASGKKIINRALTMWANAHFQVNASKINIGRIVKQKEHFSGLDVGHLGDSKHLQKSQCPEVGVILGSGIPYFPLLFPSSHCLYCLDSNSFLLPRSSKRLSTLSSKRSRPRALGWSIRILPLESSASRSLLTDGGFFFGRRRPFPFSLLLKVPSL